MRGESNFSALMGVLSTGITSGVCLVIGLGIGYQADIYFNIAPWGIVGGVIFGFAAGFLETYNQIVKGMAKLDREKNTTRKN